MNINYLFKTYKPNYYNEVKALWKETELDDGKRGDDEHVIQKTIQQDGKLILMISKSTNEIIGTSWITNDGRRLYLHHFCIKPIHQAKKLSIPLLKECLRFAKEKNMQIKLEVHSKNNKALNLYAKNGFNKLGDYQVMIIRTANG